LLNAILIVCFSLALAAVIVAFVRQTRLLRATKSLLGRFLKLNRKEPHETSSRARRRRRRSRRPPWLQ
jgi:hypothetical protein